MPDDEKITQEEIIELFGEDMPIEAAKLLWTTNELSISEVRERLRKMVAKRTLDDEKTIEAMARAMAVADGNDPDEMIDTGYAAEHYRWQAYYHSAKCQLAAHRAMIKAEKEQGE